MPKITDPATLAIRRLEKRVSALEEELALFSRGHIVMLDLLIHTALDKRLGDELESALESLRGWYVYAYNCAFAHDQPDQARARQLAIEMVDIFLARLRETRGQG